jgi:hypothetical protein
MTTKSAKVPDFYSKTDFMADVKHFYSRLKDTAEQTDEAMPVLFVKTAETFPPEPDESGYKWELSVVAFAGGFGSYEEKMKTLAAAGYKFGQERKMVVAAFFGCEAWMGTEVKDDNGELVMPSEQVNRQECLMMSGMSITGDMSAITATIMRTKKGNARFVGTETVLNDGDDGKQENNLLKAFYRGYVEGAFSPRKEEIS